MSLKKPQAKELLKWYDKNARSFSWRAPSQEIPHPYYVLLSEVMLQQTTTTTVIPYFEFFIKKWPTLQSLAEASLDDILHAWQGLGYYARARNLHSCVKKIWDDYGGEIPSAENQLLKLPGIGAYTAAAIASIAFGGKATPVDGNIIRIISRLYGIETPYPKSLPEIRKYAEHLTSDIRSGDFAQALMDLGATVCIPRTPKCSKCPWQQVCLAFKADKVKELPRKLAKKPLPVRYGIVFWLIHKDGTVLLNRRCEKGLLGGMMELPSTPWQDREWVLEKALEHAPVETQWSLVPSGIRHTFTHFHLVLKLVKGITGTKLAETLWDYPENFSKYAFPTVMKKVHKVMLENN